MTTPVVPAARSSVLRLRPGTSGSAYLNVVAGPYGSAFHRVPVPKGTWLVQLTSTFKNGARVTLIGGTGGEPLRVPGAVAATPYPTATTQVSATTDTEVEFLVYALNALAEENAQATVTLFPIAQL